MLEVVVVTAVVEDGPEDSGPWESDSSPVFRAEYAVVRGPARARRVDEARW